MQGFRSAVKKVMNVLVALEKFFLVIVTIIVTAITFANVVGRKMEASIAWSEELVINLFVLMIFLGCALSAREGSLISLSLIFDRLSVKVKKVFITIITIFNSAFWCILIKTGWDRVLSQIATGKETFSLRWPEWVFTIFLPIGAVLMLIHTLEFFLDSMCNQTDATALPEGDED